MDFLRKRNTQIGDNLGQRFGRRRMAEEDRAGGGGGGGGAGGGGENRQEPAGKPSEEPAQEPAQEDAEEDTGDEGEESGGDDSDPSPVTTEPREGISPAKEGPQKRPSEDENGDEEPDPARQPLAKKAKTR